MGASKKEHFTEKQNEFALLAKAFGHPARIAIIEHIFGVHSCTRGDILNELPLAESTISQHLKELKNAGVISATNDGNFISYSIDERSIEKLKQYFKAFVQIHNEIVS